MSIELSVVIPALNEGAAIRGVLEELKATLSENDITAEIILVDDGSTDDTATNAAREGARVIQHRSNRGYGEALKTGISAAKYDVVAITDADGTYPAHYLPRMLEALNHADMVVGARTGKDVHIPFVRRPAKWFLSHLANYVSGSRIPDLNSGLRVFRRDVVLQYLPILPSQFSWTTTVTMAMHCDKYAVVYVPIDYRARTGKSKIVPWDAMNFAILILRTAMLFNPLRVFLPLVLVCFIYAVTKTFVDLLVTGDRNISASALLMFMSSLVVLLIGMLGDAISTRLGRLNPNAVVGVQTDDVTELVVDSIPGDSPQKGGSI